jgi:hypothetical protein
MDPSLWNLLHDGSIVQANGGVPGQVALHIECLYLRDMFPGTGDGFIVKLTECSLLEYELYDELPIQALDVIASLEPEILSAKSGAPLEVCCSAGTLRLQYASAELTLDTGEPVSSLELDQAAETYWRRWEERHKADS